MATADLGSFISDNLSIFLGGGFLTAVGIFLINRRKAQKIAGEERRAQLRLPTELNELAVQGVERTITLMQASQDRLVAEIARKDAALHAKDAEIVERDERIAHLGNQLAEANTALHDLMNRLSALSRDYDVLRAQVARPRPSAAPEGDAP